MSRIILTDMGNILTRFKMRPELIAQILAGFGVEELDWAKLPATSGLVVHEKGWYHGLDSGVFTVRQVWEQLIGHYGISNTMCPYALFVSLWCQHLQPIHGVVELYKKLQDKFPLVVISNGDPEGVRHITHHLVGTHGLKFLEVFISGERGRKKPDLFADVMEFLRQQNISPSDCVFIDDIHEYVAAANALGIPAIQFDGSKESATVLQFALHGLGFC